MVRRSLIGMFIGAVALVAPAVHAGGWAVVTLDTLPDTFTAGVPVQMSFMVRQHGVTPLEGLSPTVEATSNGRTVRFAALPAGTVGRYAATVTLPHPGDWRLTVHSGFITSRLTLLPVTVIAARTDGPASGPALSAADRGRQLFVAKGCVTCHQNGLRTGSTETNMAGSLIAGKYRPEYLSRALADPASLIPRTGSSFRMPNLGLAPAEIASLVAFINSPASTAAAR